MVKINGILKKKKVECSEEGRGGIVLFLMIAISALSSLLRVFAHFILFYKT